MVSLFGVSWFKWALRAGHLLQDPKGDLGCLGICVAGADSSVLSPLFGTLNTLVEGRGRFISTAGLELVEVCLFRGAFLVWTAARHYNCQSQPQCGLITSHLRLWEGLIDLLP